jgi:DNA polymerase-1
MKKKNNLAQETFDFFPALKPWPQGYYKDLSRVSEFRNRIKGFDTETKGLTPFTSNVMILSVGLSDEPYTASSTYCRNGWNEGDLAKLKEVLENPNNILVGHNIKYDVNWITVKTGIQVRAMLFDTMFAQYLLDENLKPNDLESAVLRAYMKNTEGWIDLREYKQEVDRDNLDGQHRDDLLLYQNQDADASRRLYNYFVPLLKEQGYEKLMATSSMVLPVLSKMECRGVYLDKEWAYKTQSNLFSELVSCRYKMAEIAKTSFNPDSSQSLGNVLYKNLGFAATKTTATGQPSTDGEAIGYLVDQAHTEQQQDFLTHILAYKKQMKLLTTYYQPIERWTKYDGRVHATYSLGRFENEEGSGGTVTGRLTCKEPNLQQIPRGKEHRGMFRASEGFTLLDGDFSQLELRVAAFLSQEPVMMEAFLNNLDIHTAVMSDLTGIPYEEIEARKNTEFDIKTKRVATKRVNFGILYGVQARRLQRLLRLELGISVELDYCKDIIKQWLQRYSKVKEWLDYQKLNAVGYGWVGMPLGQKRRLPDASFEYTKEAAHALSQATNFPIQSLASWICLIGLMLLQQYIDTHQHLFEAWILMQVHDSITMEVMLRSNLITLEDIKVDVKKIMEVETLNYLRDVFGIKFNVPLVFDIEIKERWS